MNFDTIIQKIASVLDKSNAHKLFDFVSTFVMTYHGQFTALNLQTIMDALVSRVLKEH